MILFLILKLFIIIIFLTSFLYKKKILLFKTTMSANVTYKNLQKIFFRSPSPDRSQREPNSSARLSPYRVGRPERLDPIGVRRVRLLRVRQPARDLAGVQKNSGQFLTVLTFLFNRRSKNLPAQADTKQAPDFWIHKVT